MRIGNLDDPSQSEDLVKLIQAESSEKLTGTKKWKNWWHYYKWYVICGIVLLGIACDLIGNALGLWQKSPDFEIAYVGQTALPQDTAAALEEAFAQIGAGFDLSSPLSLSGADFNEDGEVIIRLNQYPYDFSYAETEAFYYEYSSEITLIGDISDCESYFFLLDDPDGFQKEYRLLTAADGSCPDEADDSTADKVIRWSDCPALAEITSIVEAQVPGSRELLSDLYIGRRCFYDDNRSDNADKCSALWDLLWSTSFPQRDTSRKQEDIS